MTAAEFESHDVLLFLVSYLKEVIECGGKNPKINMVVKTILHQKSEKFQQNLMSMVMNNDSMGLSQQILVELEASIHQWKEHEFQGWFTFVFCHVSVMTSMTNLTYDKAELHRYDKIGL